MAQHRRVTKRAAQRAARRHQQVPRRRRVTAAVLAAGAAASGASLAATTGTGTANADCVSVWGVGNSANCVSTPGNVAWVMFNTGSSFANATQGFGNIAVASGPNATAVSGLGPLDFLNFAYAQTPEGGLGTVAQAGGLGGYPMWGDFGVGIGNIAIAAGNDHPSLALASGLHNTTLVLGNTGNQPQPTTAFSYGTLNHTVVAGSQGQSASAYAFGILNTTTNLLGQPDPTVAGHYLESSGVFTHALGIYSGGLSTNAAGPDEYSFLNVAFNAFDNRDVVVAQAPFLAIAGALGVSDLLVQQIGPGITINNSALPLPFARTAPPPPALRTAAPGSDPAADGDGPVATAVSTAVNTVTTAANTVTTAVSTAVSAAADGDGDGPVTTAVNTVTTAASQVNTAVSAAAAGDGPLASAVRRTRAGDGPIATAVRQARAGDGPLATAVRQARAGDGPIATAVRQARAGDGPLASAVRQVRAGDGPISTAVRQVRDTLGANE